MSSPTLLTPSRIPFGLQKRKYGHKLIVETAVEMAHEIYEKCASDNAWHKAHPSRSAYVLKAVPYLIPRARATLTDLMTSTKDNAMKEKIYEALCLDNQIPSRIVS